MPHNLVRRAAFLGVFAGVLVATSIEGATVHLPALLLRGLAATGCVLLCRKEGLACRRRDLVAPAVALIAVGAGWLGTTNPAPAQQAVATTLLVVVLFTCAAAGNARDSRHSLYAIGAVGVVHAIWAVFDQVAGLAVAGRANAGFYNPNNLAAFLAPLTVGSLGLAIAALPPGRVFRKQISRRWVRAVILGAPLVLFGGIVASGSRSGLLAAVMGATPVAVSRLRKKPWVLVGLGVMSLVALLSIFPRWAGHRDQYAYARLSHIWPRSVQLAWAHPTGVGLAGYADAMRVYGIPFDGLVRYPKQAGNAHSEPINAWVELGWLGLAATLLAPATIAVVLWQRRRADDMSTTTNETASWSTATHWGILGSFTVPAAVSATLHVPPVALLAALWAGHLVASDRTDGAKLTLGQGLRGRSIVAFICGIALVIAMPGAISLAAMERAADSRSAGRLDEALVWAEWAERIEPNRLGAAMLAESMRFLNGAAPDDSVQRLLLLADQFPSSPRPHERAAWILEQQVVEEAAGVESWTMIAQLRVEAMRRDPLDARKHVAVGAALLNSGHAGRAEQAFRGALAVEPTCADALAHLALMAHASGATEAARELAADAFRFDGLAPNRKPLEIRVLSLHPNLETMLRKSGLGPE
ncbi:MAG: O-antigen ligase family protein [Myxococcota bacterium]